MADRKIPAFVNPGSGTADAARTALQDHGSFDVSDVEPAQLKAAIDKALAKGATRILVAGGDGTVSAGAEALLGKNAELAILPGGTLNHFARDLGIGDSAEEALKTATGTSCRAADVGMVNGKLFLNTSSVGAYVHFVILRERLERWAGYRIATTIAAFRALFQLRLLAVELKVDGRSKVYRTPLVFIGVGERELQAPAFGNRIPDGKRGLHILVVRGRSRGRLLAIALNSLARGVKQVAKTPELDSFITDECTITRMSAGRIAIDGELVRLPSVLKYSLERDAIKVACP